MSFPDVEDSDRKQLDPWRVVLFYLFEIDSYEIPDVIDAAGLAVDWSLTQREGHSHKYRKDAFRPRICRAYEALDEDDRRRVTFIVCEEIARRGYRKKLDAYLQRIGWRIAGTKLVPANETVRELFFPQGTQHDAYVHIRDIIRDAKHSLRIIDPYIDETVFTILGDVRKAMTVEILTRNLPADFAHETSRFQRQHTKVKIETRRSEDFHDRFIVIDDAKCWHIGCSIKDAGNRAFMVSAIEDRQNVEKLLEALRNTWANATNYPDSA